MKKFLSALLICTLVFALMTCAMAAEKPANLTESDIIGVWRLTTVQYQGSEFDPGMLNLGSTIEFKADHTAVLITGEIDGEQDSASAIWTLNAADATIDVSDIIIAVQSENGQLQLFMDEKITGQPSMNFIYKR